MEPSKQSRSNPAGGQTPAASLREAFAKLSHGKKIATIGMPVLIDKLNNRDQQDDVSQTLVAMSLNHP
jgi:hypothetical protein